MKKDTWWDYAATVRAVGLSTPKLLAWHPADPAFRGAARLAAASGYVSPFEDLRANLAAMIMPAFVPRATPSRGADAAYA